MKSTGRFNEGKARSCITIAIVGRNSKKYATKGGERRK